jgi:glutamate 5-kinase
MDKKILLLKVGTNLLTKPDLKLNYKAISSIIRQIAILHKKYAILFVSSGAVGAGRELLNPKIADPVVKKQVLASVGQGRLLQIYTELFQKRNIITAQALLTKKDFQNKESYYSTKEILTQLLRQNIIPIINENDVTSSVENTFGDNDQLAALTAALMEASMVIILTDTLGLYQQDPKKNEQAELIKRVENIDEKILSFAKHSLSKGGTGGMYSKVKSAQITTSHGIPTILCSGKEQDALLKAVSQENYGTYFKALRKKKIIYERKMDSNSRQNLRKNLY